MATKIEAINAFRPRIILGKAASEERYMELITQRTTLSPGVVRNVQESELENSARFVAGRPPRAYRGCHLHAQHHAGG